MDESTCSAIKQFCCAEIDSRKKRYETRVKLVPIQARIKELKAYLLGIMHQHKCTCVKVKGKELYLRAKSSPPLSVTNTVLQTAIQSIDVTSLPQGDDNEFKEALQSTLLQHIHEATINPTMRLVLSKSAERKRKRRETEEDPSDVDPWIPDIETESAIAEFVSCMEDLKTIRMELKAALEPVNAKRDEASPIVKTHMQRIRGSFLTTSQKITIEVAGMQRAFFIRSKAPTATKKAVTLRFVSQLLPDLISNVDRTSVDLADMYEKLTSVIEERRISPPKTDEHQLVLQRR